MLIFIVIGNVLEAIVEISSNTATSHAVQAASGERLTTPPALAA